MAQRTSYEPGTPNWVDLATPDLEGAKRFYGELFGWTFEDGGEEAGHYHQALLRGRRVAGLGPSQPGGPPQAVWTTYLCGSDADAHARTIEARGGRVLVGPLDVMGFGQMLIGEDATGAAFGIWQPGSHTGAEIVNEPGSFVWNELNTRDRAAAQRFYGGLFPYAFDDLPDVPSGYSVVMLGDRAVGGILQMTEEWGDLPPHWMTYFEVADADAALARATELGGTVVVQPIDSAYGRFGVVQDPQGGVVTLMRSASPDP